MPQSEFSFFNKTIYVQCFIAIAIGRLLFKNGELLCFFVLLQTKPRCQS